MKKTGLKVALLLMVAAFISATAFTTVYATEVTERETKAGDISEAAAQETEAGDTSKTTDTNSSEEEIIDAEEASSEKAAAGAFSDETDDTEETTKDIKTDEDDSISEAEADENDVEQKATVKSTNTGKTKKNKKASYTAKDLKYLSAIIFCEANNHSFKSKVAVANVVLNRKNDTKLWGHVSTVKQVIYDKKWGVQFTPAYSSSNSMKAALNLYTNIDEYKGNWRYDSMKSCIKAAKAALEGKKNVPDNYFYFNANVKTSKSKCKAKGKEYKIIDSHIYF